MSFLAFLILGLIAGAIAKLILPGRQGGGWFITLLLGVLGALLGGWLGSVTRGVLGAARHGARCYRHRVVW